MEKKLSYEEALGRLESIVAEIEGASLPIEKIIDKVKEATGLVDYCRASLRSCKEDLEKAINNSVVQ